MKGFSEEALLKALEDHAGPEVRAAREIDDSRFRHCLKQMTAAANSVAAPEKGPRGRA